MILAVLYSSILNDPLKSYPPLQFPLVVIIDTKRDNDTRGSKISSFSLTHKREEMNYLYVACVRWDAIWILYTSNASHIQNNLNRCLFLFERGLKRHDKHNI